MGYFVKLLIILDTEDIKIDIKIRYKDRYRVTK